MFMWHAYQYICWPMLCSYGIGILTNNKKIKRKHIYTKLKAKTRAREMRKNEDKQIQKRY